MISQKVLLLVMAFCFFSYPAFAQLTIEDLNVENTVLITDFDGTFTGRDWPSFWKLRRVPYVQNVLQSMLPGRLLNKPGLTVDQLPSEVFVTEREFYELLESDLAVKEKNGEVSVGQSKVITLPGLPGTLRPKSISFLPGLYYVTAESFDFFRANPKSQLLTDYRSTFSLKNHRQIFGIAFPLFQQMISSPQKGKDIFIVTARGQSPDEFKSLITEMNDQKVVNTTTNDISQITVFNLGSNEAVLYGHRLAEQKVNVVRDHIIAHYRLLAQQEKINRTIVVAEDNPQIIQKYYELFTELSALKEYRSYLRFVLIHAGTATEISLSPLKARVVEFQNGFAKPVSKSVERYLLPPTNPADTHVNPHIVSTNSSPASKQHRCLSIFSRSSL